jgi:hypothetical protein
MSFQENYPKEGISYLNEDLFLDRLYSPKTASPQSKLMKLFVNSKAHSNQHSKSPPLRGNTSFKGSFEGSLRELLSPIDSKLIEYPPYKSPKNQNDQNRKFPAKIPFRMENGVKRSFIQEASLLHKTIDEKRPHTNNQSYENLRGKERVPTPKGLPIKGDSLYLNLNGITSPKQIASHKSISVASPIQKEKKSEKSIQNKRRETGSKALLHKRDHMYSQPKVNRERRSNQKSISYENKKSKGYSRSSMNLFDDNTEDITNSKISMNKTGSMISDAKKSRANLKSRSIAKQDTAETLNNDSKSKVSTKHAPSASNTENDKVSPNRKNNSAVFNQILTKQVLSDLPNNMTFSSHIEYMKNLYHQKRQENLGNLKSEVRKKKQQANPQYLKHSLSDNISRSPNLTDLAAYALENGSKSPYGESDNKHFRSLNINLLHND